MISNKELIEKIKKFFLTLNEFEFTLKVVKPYLERNYTVEYHNKPNEKGKDLICTKKDEFLGEESIIVAQIKACKISTNTSDRNSLQQLLTQIEECFDEEISTKLGQKVKPQQVLFISSHPVEIGKIESCESRFRKQIERGLNVIDADKLALLITKNSPELAKQLLGFSLDPEIYLSEKPTNLPLLTALNAANKPELNVIYSDLNFSFGGISMEKLISMRINNNTPITIKINSERFNQTKDELQVIFESFDEETILPSIEQAQLAYKAALNEFESKRNRELIKEVEKIESSLLEHLDNIEKNIKSIKPDHHNKPEDYPYSLEAELNKIVSICTETKNNAKMGIFNPSPFPMGNYEKNKNEKHWNSTNVASTFELLAYTNELSSQRNKKHSKVHHEPLYEFEINTQLLGEKLSEKAFSYKKQFCNDKTWTSKNLFGRFIDDSKSLVKLIRAIEQASEIKNKLNITHEHNETIAISGVHLFNIFDTGADIAIIGDAGSGKSTTLERYSIHRKTNSKNSENIIFLPLARLNGATDEIHKEDDKITEEEIETWFHNQISNIYKDAGLDIAPSQIGQTINKAKKNIFILDGLDEIGISEKFFSKIINSIKANKNNQIIISSRFTFNPIKAIDFSEIQLLPFGSAELDKFIGGWFNSEPSKARILKSHIKSNSKLADVVKNPLMATILCVLTDHNIELPTDEASIYEERNKLLLGHYDSAKGIKRTKTPDQMLYAVARQAAYVMHSTKTRSMGKEKLINLISSRYPKANCTRTSKLIEELIDPCNIMIEMQHNQEIGFGHLRYQEFLAAKELQLNRGIEIIPLLSDHWWYDVLYLFGSMTDGVSSIIDEASEKLIGQIHFVHDGLLKLISGRPIEEQKNLKEIINMLSKQDRLDSYIQDDYGEIYD